MIKYMAITFVLLFGVAHTAFAQLDISCRIEPTRAVLYEPVIATVRIQNNTGQAVTLSDDTPGARIWMEIEQTPGRSVRQSDPLVLGEPLVIPPRESATRRINLTRVYDMRNTGPYTVRARLDWGGQAYVSGRIFLDVVPGLEVTRTTGSAAPDGTDRRLYRLLSLNRDRGEHLFLQIDDEARGICYGVIHLGRIVRVQRPMLLVDGSNNINVLHQAGPGRYFHHVFTPNGDKVERRVYTSEDPGVSLVHGRDGRITVDGAATSLHDDR